MAYIVTCNCCGVALDNEEAEIALDWEGDECFMCHRCFNEECDCHTVWQEPDENGLPWTYVVIR